MELHADEPGMVFILDHFRQQPVRRHAGKAHAMLLEPALVAGIDLVAVPVALGNLGGAVVNLRYTAAALKDRRIGAKPHGAAEIAVDTAGLEFVALYFLGHYADH